MVSGARHKRSFQSYENARQTCRILNLNTMTRFDLYIVPVGIVSKLVRKLLECWIGVPLAISDRSYERSFCVFGQWPVL